MKARTRALWLKQDQHVGDRWRLFQTVGAAVPARRVLYPGSYVDVAPSFVYDDVTYADIDKRAAEFFADTEGVTQIIGEHGGNTSGRVAFLHGNYRTLELEAESFDLLISLYAGFISDACGHLVRRGGMLLVNSSHGDAALAALDPRFSLCAVVSASGRQYHVSSEGLDGYMVPKSAQEITKAAIEASGCGIAYTRSPFAYLFKKVL